MHPAGGADNFLQLLPLIWLVSLWSVFSINWVDLTLDYYIVLHLLLLNVEVRSIELP